MPKSTDPGSAASAANASAPSLLVKPVWIDRTAFLDRILGRFTQVNEGEGFSAFLLALNVIAFLASFNILKSVREALILVEGGPEVKSYAAAAQSLILLLVVPVYGLIASRFDRVKLIDGVNAFFLLQLLLFAFLGRQGLAVGKAFYLWLGVLNVLVIAQFWAFAADVYSEEQGRRLFVIVAVGGPSGAIIGAALNLWLFPLLGPFLMMYVAAGLMAVGLFLTVLVNRYVCECGGPQSVIAQLPIGKDGGFQLLLRERYLFYIAILVLLLNWITSAGDYLQSRILLENTASLTDNLRRVFLAQYYSNYFWWSSVVGLAIQLTLTGKVINRIGIANALYILPVLTLGNSLALLAMPVLGVARLARVAETSLENSLHNTASQSLYLGTSREAKYKAKSAIDTFFWRTGDLLQAGVVKLGLMLEFTTRHFVFVNLGVIGLWLVTVAAMSREQKKRQKRRGRGAWRVADNQG